MRCGLRKKIQHTRCKTQPRKEIIVGKPQVIETANKTVQNCTDSKVQDHELHSTRNKKRACQAACIARSVVRACGTAGTKVLIFFIRIYQRAISPLFPACCRFEPTCSKYAVEALQKHGLVRGSLLTICRLARCQPFCKGGFDPVPNEFHLRRHAPKQQDTDK